MQRFRLIGYAVGEGHQRWDENVSLVWWISSSRSDFIEMHTGQGSTPLFYYSFPLFDQDNGNQSFNENIKLDNRPQHHICYGKCKGTNMNLELKNLVNASLLVVPPCNVARCISGFLCLFQHSHIRSIFLILTLPLSTLHRQDSWHRE